MSQDLSSKEIAHHLTAPDGNDWTGRGQYVAADDEGRAEVRALVADHIKALLTHGVDGNLADGAVTAENICNAMWHLMSEAEEEDELTRTERTESAGA
ncbi:hypothetical protein [Streptomyces acidiscabies]|uniref:Uncharacterized protein n=1 Tax=Streptomyces acidiscabies TaxID=42234 RepID=A0ABU4LWK9_9ACTN|nr:hypothetical protein [Streptomyces acidiscabies]MDX3020098.1 hypothetical protein [Streptomyces acidiscabies]